MFFFNYFLLKCSVVLVSGIQQSESFIHIHVCVLNCFSCVQLFANLWTVACQAPLSMGFSRQEYWSGLPFPYPEDHPNPGIGPTSPALAGRFFTAEPQGNPSSESTPSINHLKRILISGSVCREPNLRHAYEATV